MLETMPSAQGHLRTCRRSWAVFCAVLSVSTSVLSQSIENVVAFRYFERLLQAAALGVLEAKALASEAPVDLVPELVDLLLLEGERLDKLSREAGGPALDRYYPHAGAALGLMDVRFFLRQCLAQVNLQKLDVLFELHPFMALWLRWACSAFSTAHPLGIPSSSSGNLERWLPVIKMLKRALDEGNAVASGSRDAASRQSAALAIDFVRNSVQTWPVGILATRQALRQTLLDELRQCAARLRSMRRVVASLPTLAEASVAEASF